MVRHLKNRVAVWPREAGFSLIEILMALTLCALALMAVFGLLNGGLRVAERLQSKNQYGTVALAAEQMEQDLRNAYPFYAIPFEGDSATLTLPGWQIQPSGQVPVRIRYEWDSKNAVLWRAIYSFPAQTLLLKETLMTGLASFQWTYLNPENPGEGGNWMGQWADTNQIPGGVRWDIRLRTTDMPTFRRTVILPRSLKVLEGNT